MRVLEQAILSSGPFRPAALPSLMDLGYAEQQDHASAELPVILAACRRHHTVVKHQQISKLYACRHHLSCKAVEEVDPTTLTKLSQEMRLIACDLALTPVCTLP